MQPGAVCSETKPAATHPVAQRRNVTPNMQQRTGRDTRGSACVQHALEAQALSPTTRTIPTWRARKPHASGVAWIGSLGATRPASASAPVGAVADPARPAADHLADSGVGTGTMRTTSSMQPPTAIVPTEPAAMVGMGASAQTQSRRCLSASLRLRVLSSLARTSHRSSCHGVRGPTCARMHAQLRGGVCVFG